MVTYIKIGSCDELKEWGKYDPIPATTECCCCGTTVIDIITPNKDKPIVVPDKPNDSSSSSDTKPSTDNSGTEQPKPTEPSGSSDTSTTTPSDNTSSGSTDNSGTTTPSTPSTGDTTTPSDSGTTGNTDTNTTPSNDDSSSNGNTDTGSTSGGTSTTPSGNTDTGSTSNPTDETKPSTSTDSGSNGSTDTSSSSQTEPSKPAEKKITNTFNLTYEGEDEGVYYTFTVTGNKGDVVNIFDYIKDKVKKNDEGNYYFTVDGNDYVYTDGDLMTETRTLEYDGASEDFVFSEHAKREKITNTVNLTYSGKDKGIYYSFNISGYSGDKVPVWDYIKDKVQQDEDGKYYITVNGDKYPYAVVNNDLKERIEIIDGATTKRIPFEYPKEDEE